LAQVLNIVQILDIPPLFGQSASPPGEPPGETLVTALLIRGLSRFRPRPGCAPPRAVPKLLNGGEGTLRAPRGAARSASGSPRTGGPVGCHGRQPVGALPKEPSPGTGATERARPCRIAPAPARWEVAAMRRRLGASVRRRHGKRSMGCGEFTRAAARPTASAAGCAPETQPRLPALPKGRTSPQVTRQARKTSLTPIPPSVPPHAAGRRGRPRYPAV